MTRLWLALAMLVACSRDPSPRTVPGAPTMAPDDQFETDGPPSYRAFVWEHTPNNERVVIYRKCEAGACGEWKLERTLWPGSRCDIAMPAGAGW